jgi:hypothetical protein
MAGVAVGCGVGVFVGRAVDAGGDVEAGVDVRVGVDVSSGVGDGVTSPTTVILPSSISASMNSPALSSR